MEMTDYIQIFTTAEKKKDAEKLAKEVVEKRLAACVQVLGPIESTYWWEGEVEKAEEWLCIMKSRNDLYGELEKVIKGIHPYDVPEILAMPIVSGNPVYLQWVDKEVGDKSRYTA